MCYCPGKWVSQGIFFFFLHNVGGGHQNDDLLVDSKTRFRQLEAPLPFLSLECVSSVLPILLAISKT